MWDGILGRGFSVKCKSLIKPTRVRIDVVRRRAHAKQRFLKEDLAKLLANGLDINAYGRTEEYLAGMDLLSCYDFVEQSCEYTAKQLSRMQKQRECPEECREAVASLMYAAARFSDLPELRELRDIFQQRYGNYLETFVNQKFVEKLSSRSPALEKRIQVLRDIASEFLIKWDSSGFERRMANPVAAAQVNVQKVDIVKQKPGLPDDKKSRVPDLGENILGRDEANHRFSGRKETVECRDKSVLNNLHNDYGELSSRGKHTVSKNKQSFPIEKGDADLKVERSNSSSHGKILDNSVHTRYIRSSNGIQNLRKGESKAALFRDNAEVALGRSEDVISYNYSNQDNANNSITKGVDSSDSLKSCSSYALPPPYVKSKDNTPRPSYIKPKEEKHNMDSSSCGSNIRLDPGDSKDQLIAPAKPKNYYPEKDLEKTPLPKPRSIKRKHHKSSTGHNVLDALEEDVGAVVSRSSSSRRKDHSRKGLQILFDDEHHKKDDEERMIDKLLIHYCKKPSSHDAGNSKKKSYHQINGDVCESSGDAFPHPTRSVSLPNENPTSPLPKEVFMRSNTFEPDHNQARHVHPKLPNYDDLAARFVALKGR